MARKKKLRESSPELGSVYEVETIRKARITDDKKWEYLIKWYGYSEADNSWEPQRNLTGCLQMLQDFWDRASPGQRSQAVSLPYGFEVVPRTILTGEQHISMETIIQTSLPVADRSSKPVDDVPLVNDYSDPDDMPLSRLQALHKSQTPRVPEKDQALFSQPEVSSQAPKPGTPITHLSSSVPAHRRRKLQPKVKSIDVVENFQAISTKFRIARRVSGPTILPAAAHNAIPSPGSPSDSSGLNVEQFLKDATQNVDSPTVSTPTIALPTFNKRWKWSGQMCVGDNDNESDDGFSDSIGNVKIADAVPCETRQKELSMGLLIPSSVDTLYFRHNYSLVTLPTALSGFRITHFARMTADLPTANGGSAESRMNEDNLFFPLAHLMERNHLYSCMSITTQMKDPITKEAITKEVASMFIVPASIQQLWDTINLPEKLRQIDAVPSLLVIMGMHIREPSKVESRRTVTVVQENTFWKSKASQFTQTYLLSFPDLGCAVMKLEFPEQLLKKLSRHKYAVFTGSVSSNTVFETDPYTRGLKLAMDKSGAERLPLHDGEARSVFIHVKAWKILHKLLGLVDRRLRRLDIEFFTYGADPTVERRFWGVQPVFPIGGLVTFTSQSIVENPEGAVKLIGKLHEHCLWTCYIHPAVISMLAKFLKGNAEVVVDIKKLTTAHKCLEYILRAIEKEQLEVIWHPPAPHQQRRLPSHIDVPTFSPDYIPSRMLWSLEQERLSKSPATKLIDICERGFPAEAYTEKGIENLLVEDMTVMQSEFRKEYRRFVIITDTGTASNASKGAANVSASSYELKDMFEFAHIDKFKFDEESPKLNSVRPE